MNSTSTSGAAGQALTESHDCGTGHPADEVFPYRPLNFTSKPRQTRLLKLLPAESLKDEIRCTLLHTSLDDSPVYEALSYEWGGEVTDDSPSILLSYGQDGGLGSERRFKITRNLDAALRHIRLPTSSRTLWNDVTCINQKDTKEKEYQIGFMRDIYLKAQSVVAWLGGEKDTMEALKFLNSISWVATDVSDYKYNRNDSIKWRACDDLFGGRSYWKRTWILQEVLHDKEVIFQLGMKTISIEDLSACYDKYFFAKLNLISERDDFLIKRNSKDLSEQGNWRYDGWFRATATAASAPDTLFTMREQFVKNPKAEAPRLSRLLYMYRDHEAKNGRDKIYAMMGMAKPEYTIPIDYGTRETGGLSTGDIFTITTRQMLERVLLVLLSVESPTRNIASSLDNDTLPSWVPDFTTKRPLTARTMDTTYNYFSADEGFPDGMSSKNSDPSLPKNYPLFVVRGIYVACITGIQVTYVTSDRIVNEDFPDFPDFHRLKLIRYDRDPSLRKGTAEGKCNVWPKTNNGTPISDISFENTSWGPCQAEVGDIIIVAAGCKIPLVLRKHGEEYLLVGGCWLVEKRIKNLRNLQERDDAFSGVMYGDAVKEIKSGRAVEEFVLC